MTPLSSLIPSLTSAIEANSADATDARDDLDADVVSMAAADFFFFSFTTHKGRNPPVCESLYLSDVLYIIGNELYS